MNAAELEAALIGAERDGIVTSAALRAAGVTGSAIHNLRRRGVLVQLGRGVDRLRDHPFGLRSRCRAALAIAGTGAVLGLRTAARLHGFYSFRDAPDVEVLSPRSKDHATSIGRIVQTRWLPPEHSTLVDGLPCTTAARTFFDLAGDPLPGMSVAHAAHQRFMARVYDDALARRGMTFTQEAAVLTVLARRGRAGTQLVRNLLLELGPAHSPTHSDAEFLFMEVVHAHGLPEPEKQVAMTDEQGFIGTVDFLWRSARLVVEVDSTWHDGPLARRHDAERDRRLLAAGYQVRRYRYGEMIARPTAIACQLGMVVNVMASTTIPNSGFGGRVRGAR